MFEDINSEEAWIEAIENIDPKRQAIAYERACKTVGIEAEWVGGVLQVHSDDMYEEEVLDEFANELRKMAVQDALDALKENDLVEVSVNEEGQLMYSLTEEGKKAAEDILGEE